MFGADWMMNPNGALAGAEQYPEGYRAKTAVALGGVPNEPEGLSATTARAKEGQPCPLMPPDFVFGWTDARVHVCT